jgi:membrane protein
VTLQQGAKTVALRVWNVLRQTFARWNRNDGNVWAASMAYYAAFSFFPLLMVLISCLGFALRFSSGAASARVELLDFISQHTGPALADQVELILSQVRTQAPFNSLVGSITLFIGAIGIFSQLESAFDRIWHEATPHDHGVWPAVRNALWNRLKAFLTLVGLGLLVIAGFFADVALAAVRTSARDVPLDNAFWQWLQLGTSAVSNAIVLTLLYKMLPRAPVRLVHAACGGLAVAVVWQVGSQLVSRFIVGGKYTAYGVVGAFIAMMLWVYCASIVLFLGAQLVQVLGHPENHDQDGVR